MSFLMLARYVLLTFSSIGVICFSRYGLLVYDLVMYDLVMYDLVMYDLVMCDLVKRINS